MVQRIGLVGCGVISDIYLRNAALFRDIRFTACADMRRDAAEQRATEYGLQALSLDELYASPEVDIVLNLTNPDAHAAVALKALDSGKHVYGEKPLATSLEDGRRIVETARGRGLQVGSAPDTILGPGLQTCRRMVDDGTVGEVVSGVATIMSRGMEHWHPAPAFYFRPGGGPVLDMGPYYVGALVTLLGPVAKVTAAARVGLPERTVTAPGPNVGQRIAVEVPTTVHAVLTFAGGAQVTLLASWDVWKHAHLPIELHGVSASLRVPDPNFFGGRIELAKDRDAWEATDTSGRFFGKPTYPFDKPVHANFRGLGLAEMANAIENGRQARVNGDWAFHTLEVMLAILCSAQEERTVAIESTCERPAALSDAEAQSLLADGRAAEQRRSA
ncbi:Gfo/Idh/MocA family protein [Antarcticirhabdus aurantiaca]|uniref:Gfo/Idh/MocA family oxidoreductase n=1 Tax=Antarcticirhabdus aurantiaca TaxID=2606717 RepID=A0ACD4NPN1_9HYPH|nr:Gfo/Idh/MocA family oxidoreductase [Antarcticirhabdus aurantiaca]WAJ28714.1 Gfo/Idh/MocA family oxidoreductase [Jeongeuplla avenae]